MIEILSYSKSTLTHLLNDWLNWDAAMRRNKIIEDIERAQEKELQNLILATLSAFQSE